MLYPQEMKLLKVLHYKSGVVVYAVNPPQAGGEACRQRQADLREFEEAELCESETGGIRIVSSKRARAMY